MTISVLPLKWFPFSSAMDSTPHSPLDALCSAEDAPVDYTNPSKAGRSCLVCGDKALGHNFSAVSCESCKAFFRRNAHKIIRGRCEGKCEVTVHSRSFCKKCRLAKCFTVGMRKEMILNDEQKKQRTEKIIVNKLRKQGQLPAEDTYSASFRDLLCPIRGLVATSPNQVVMIESAQSPSGDTKQEVTGLQSSQIASRSPSLMSSVTSKPCLTFISRDCHTGNLRMYRSMSSTCSSSDEAMVCYSPWKDSQGQVHAILDILPKNDQSLISELTAAMEAGSFLVMSCSSLKMIPSNPEEFINMAELFVRKVIKVAKNITFFKQLHKDDQISLLKGSVVDIMMLRSAVNYDPFTESWSLNTKGCINQGSGQATGERISAEILKSGSSETRQLFMTYSKFIKSLMFTIHGDLLALKLLILMSLFSADRMPMLDYRRVQEIQETYAHILEEYISLRFNHESNLFARVVMKLTDLRNINEVHSKMLLRMKVDEFEPLLLEIFDLPADMDCSSITVSGKGVGLSSPQWTAIASSTMGHC